MENINAVLIDEGVPQGDRLVRLNQIAINQMRVLENDDNRNLLKWHEVQPFKREKKYESN